MTSVVEMSDGLKELTLDIDGQATRFVAGNATPATLTWPGRGVGSQIKLTTVPAGATAMAFEGPWALFRMFDRFEIQPSGRPERFTVVMNLDGRHAKLEVTASSVFNPFRMREILDFRCPGAL